MQLTVTQQECLTAERMPHCLKKDCIRHKQSDALLNNAIDVLLTLSNMSDMTPRTIPPGQFPPDSCPRTIPPWTIPPLGELPPGQTPV